MTYERLVAPSLRVCEQELVEVRLSQAQGGDDQLDDLMRASGARMRQWMATKARNADGLRPSMAMAPASAIEATV